MSDGTRIEWTDATWNAITGCSVVSPGCTNCYAMKLAGTRLRHHPSRAGLTTKTKAGPVWTGDVRFNEEWLDQPLRWKRPRRIFVCAHGDLFHENVPDEWIDKVFAVMALSPQHVFQVLTKRPERARTYLSDEDARGFGVCMEAARILKRDPGEPPEWPLSNVWLGVSVEDQARADERIPILLDTPAAVRWISAEPLLGPVDIEQWLYDSDCRLSSEGVCTCSEPREARLDWVVAGGESGPGARPMHPDWARSLRDQCQAAEAAFHFKQFGDWLHNSQLDAEGRPGGEVFELMVADRRLHRWPDGSASIRAGKRAAGRLLDGREWNGWPA